VSISLDDAVELTRTGDIWVFRGRAPADRAIQFTTNSPVNHVGMSVVLDDLPPLIWHAELGRSLPDRWSGNRHRGVQLHDLRDAVLVWANRYRQRAWLRQLDGTVTRAMEDAMLRTIARLDGTPFPSTAGLAGRWLRGRIPRVGDRIPVVRGRIPVVRGRIRRRAGSSTGAEEPAANADQSGADQSGADQSGPDQSGADRAAGLETAYCAEVVAITYDAMGLLASGRPATWYDPGRFWSGDELKLTGSARLGDEIEIEIPPS
jgi:hypothetical protein